MKLFSNHKPIQYFIIYLFFTAGGATLVLFSISGRELHVSHLVFFVIMIAWHLITAVGMLLKYKIGFFLFKLYLYGLYIGFPIGTYVAKWYFSYIQEYQLEHIYDKKVSFFRSKKE